MKFNSLNNKKDDFVVFADARGLNLVQSVSQSVRHVSFACYEKSDPRLHARWGTP